MRMLRSFKYAFTGMATAFGTQPNFRIELLAAVTAVAAGFWLHISPGEWLAVILSIALVLSLELINTAIESACDLFSRDVHPQIKFIKDVAAAAVLLGAVSAVICGLIIFLPKIIALF